MTCQPSGWGGRFYSGEGVAGPLPPTGAGAGLWMNLNGVMAFILPYFAEAFVANYVKVVDQQIFSWEMW